MSSLMLVLTAACGSKKASAPPPHSQVVPKVSQEDIAKCLREPVTLRAGNGYHVLASGETLYRVSRIYDTTVDELIEINNIQDYTDIPTGTRLRVPGVAGVAEPSSLIWPLPGSISSGYGKRGRRFHWGIDIPAPSGTPIRAPADGLVLVSTNGGKGFTGYGRVVVIAHGNGISTLYAHNRSNEVKAGSCIRAGEVLGKVGATGNATGNHLHFEIRKNGKPVNPLDYLP
ncbi:MAG: M23 family metallopeptidase [Thermodesulfobacteriota bacterium]